MRGGGERRATFCGDARDLRFGTLVGRFRHTRVLLHRQSAHGRLRFGGKRLLIIGTIVDAGADEHLAGQRLRLEFVILIVFGHICCFLGLSRFLLVAFHVLRYSTHAPARYERHIRKSPGRIASAHSGDSSTQLTIPTRAATAVRPTDRVRDRKVERNRKAVRNRKKFSVRRRQADWRSDHPNGGLPRNPPIPTW